jgi:hypothetical protein
MDGFTGGGARGTVVKTSEVSGVTGFAQQGLRYLVSSQADSEGA